MLVMLVTQKKNFEESRILWKSMATVNCLVTNILQNIFFCVQQNKETHTGLLKLEGE